MQAALRLLRAQAPELEVEGEMQADLAFDEETRLKLFPGSLLRGQANLLIMPTLDAANIALNLFRGVGDGLSVGPILVGAARPAHILTPTAGCAHRHMSATRRGRGPGGGTGRDVAA